jgi:Transposase
MMPVEPAPTADHPCIRHRGRKHDPLYRIRKLLIAGSERLVGDGTQRLLLGLRVGDPNNEILGAWLAKESVRDALDADSVADAATLLDKTIVGCANDSVGEIRALGKTLTRWRTEILAHHQTAASNGPTEVSTCSSGRSSAAAEGSRTSSTTGFACSSVPAFRHGPSDHHHPSSERPVPTLTRRACYRVRR